MQYWQCILCMIVHMVANAEKIPRGQNLIVFIIDGYGKTLLNQSDVGFRLLTQNGVYTDFLKPVYPTHNYPNWMSLVTGDHRSASLSFIHCILRFYDFKFIARSFSDSLKAERELDISLTFNSDLAIK